MGIQERHTTALFDVLLDEIENEGRFAAPWRSDYMSVPHALIRCETNLDHPSQVPVRSKDETFIGSEALWRSLRSLSLPEKTGEAHGG